MGARIFTVDDNPIVTGVLALKLESLGHTVRVFAGSAELLAALRRDRPDLLLLDVEMPGLSGLDLLDFIKREALLPEVPVLMLTGVDEPDFIARAHRAGASGYLTKPFDLEKLCAKLAEMLGVRPPIWTDDVHTVRRRRRMSGLAGAPEGLRELAEAVGLEPLKPLLRELDAELAGFVDAPPEAPRELARQAHGLIGAAGGVGFIDLAEACRALEAACKAGRDCAAPLAAAQGEARAVRRVVAHVAGA